MKQACGSHRLLADLQANIIPVKGLAPGLFNALRAVVNKIGSALYRQ